MKRAFFVHPLGYVTIEHPLHTCTFITELQMTLLLSWISYNNISQERLHTCAEGLIRIVLPQSDTFLRPFCQAASLDSDIDMYRPGQTLVGEGLGHCYGSSTPSSSRCSPIWQHQFEWSMPQCPETTIPCRRWPREKSTSSGSFMRAYCHLVLC